MQKRTHTNKNHLDCELPYHFLQRDIFQWYFKHQKEKKKERKLFKVSNRKVRSVQININVTAQFSFVFFLSNLKNYFLIDS